MAYAPPRPGTGRDATPLLRGGIAAIKVEDREELPMTASTTWSPAERRAIARLLERNALALQMLRQTRGLPDSRFGFRYASTEPMEFSADRSYSHAVRLLALDAKVAVREGAFDRAIEDVQTLARVGRAYLQEPVDLFVHLGAVTEQLQLDVIGSFVEHPGIKAPHLSSCQASLQDVNLGASWHRARVREMVVFQRQFHRDLKAETGIMALPVWLQGPSMEADVLAGARSVLSLHSDPEARSPTGRPAAFALVASLGGQETADRIKATYALRSLTSAALDLRQRALVDGVYPEARIKREVVRYTRAPDGSATLELVGDRKAWPGALKAVALRRSLPSPAARR